MATKYRKGASEHPQPKVRKIKRYPELALAAEIAGVSYWMAYGVRRGRNQSEKVKIALQMAREQLRQRKAEEQKDARKRLRELKAEQRKIERALEKGHAA